jgi:nickel superoxide dismutase
MKKQIAALLSLLALASIAGAHCQIPCGIYDDAARISEMEEHVTTIEKSMKEIVALSDAGGDAQTGNQLIRWVMNKEAHADKLTEITTYYFLAQRIKASSPSEKYTQELKLLHGIMVSAMKAKQTVDLKHVEELRKLITDFEKIYFGEAATAPHTH